MPSIVAHRGDPGGSVKARWCAAAPGGTVTGLTERLARIRRVEGDVRRADPPVPRSVKIELTAQCDLGCWFCAARTRPRLRGEMPRPLFERLARELRESGVEHLGLFYIGESFQCAWLEDAIRFAKRDCGFPLVFLTTNGVHATPERVRGCMEAGLDSLKFSVNAGSAEQFARVTGSEASRFRTVVENVRLARAVRDGVAADGGHRCGLYASTLGLTHAPAEAVDAIAEAVDEHYELPLFGYRTDAAGGAGARLPEARKPVPCWSLFTEGHITHDGRLSACCLDHAVRFDMGDLARARFVDAWLGPRFRALRVAHLRGDVAGTVCADCIGYSPPRATAPACGGAPPPAGG